MKSWGVSKCEPVKLKQSKRGKYLVERLGVLVETAMGLFEAIVDRLKGRFDWVLKFRKSDSSLIRVWSIVKISANVFLNEYRGLSPGATQAIRRRG